jgi:hypothetical protein
MYAGQRKKSTASFLLYTNHVKFGQGKMSREGAKARLQRVIFKVANL